MKATRLDSPANISKINLELASGETKELWIESDLELSKNSDCWAFLLLVLLVLMQRPKQEGLGAAFGASTTDQLFGARTTNVLQKGTVYMASLFFVLTLTLAILMQQKNKVKSIAEEKPLVEATQPETPPSAELNAAATSAPVQAPTAAATPVDPVTPPAAPTETPAAPATPAEAPAVQPAAPAEAPAAPASTDPAKPESTTETDKSAPK